MVFVWSWSITAPLFDSLEQGEMFLWKCVWHCRKQVIVLRNRMGGDVVWFQSCPTLKRLSSCLRAHSALFSVSTSRRDWLLALVVMVYGEFEVDPLLFLGRELIQKWLSFEAKGQQYTHRLLGLASTFLPCGSPSGTKAIVHGFLVD